MATTTASSKKAEEVEKSAIKATKALISIGGNKYAKAEDRFLMAANLYKLESKYEDSARCMAAAAECMIKQKDETKAAMTFYEAGKSADAMGASELAIENFNRAIRMFCDQGRVVMAAKAAKDIAEIHEDNENLADAVEFYKRAADYYKTDDKILSAAKVTLKAAQHQMTLNKYKAASDLFMKAARAQLKSDLSAPSAKDVLFKSGLCAIAGLSADDMNDMDYIRTTVDAFHGMCTRWEDSREAQLLTAIIDACEKADLEGFAAAVEEHSRFLNNDSYFQLAVTEIKSRIEQKMRCLV